jgi:GT2 family glycosyltransferase
MSPKLALIFLAHAPRASAEALSLELSVSLQSLVAQGINCWEAHVVVCAKQEEVLRKTLQTSRITWHVVHSTTEYRLDLYSLLKNIRPEWFGLMYGGDVLRPDFLYWVLQPVLTSAENIHLVTYGEKLIVEAGAHCLDGLPSYPVDQVRTRLSPDLQWESGYLESNFIARKDFALKQLSRYPLTESPPLNIMRALANRLVAPMDKRRQAIVSRVRHHLVERRQTSPIRTRLQCTAGSKRALTKDLRQVLTKIDPQVRVRLTHAENAWLQVDWSISFPFPTVHIVIPTRDRLELLRACMRSLLNKTDYLNYRVTVVDNGSVEQETLRYLAKLPKLAAAKNVELIVTRDDQPFNFSALNNRAVCELREGVLVFLNNDTLIQDPKWLEQMVRHAIRPDIGCVGAKLLYPDGTIQHLGVCLGATDIASHLYRSAHPKHWPSNNPVLSCTSNPIAITGAAMAIRAQLFHDVGGFNQDQLPVAYNDVDLCLRLEALGYRTVCQPRATLIHQESMSRTLTSIQGYQESQVNPANQVNLKLSDVKRERQESNWMRKRWSSQLALYSGNLFS